MGRYVTFDYYGDNDASGSLMDVKTISLHYGNTASGSKDIAFTYYKGNNSNGLAHQIQTLTDSKGQIYVTNTYDSNGRVALQTYGDGSVAYAYTLGDMHVDDTLTQPGSGTIIGQYVQTNTVIDKNGNKTVYTYDRMGNMLKRRVFNEDASAFTDTVYTYNTS